MKVERIKTNETMFQTRVNMCQLSKAHYFARLWIKELKKGLNFNIECPFESGLYSYNAPQDLDNTEYWSEVSKIIRKIPAWIQTNETFRFNVVASTRKNQKFDFIGAQQLVVSLANFSEQ